MLELNDMPMLPGEATRQKTVINPENLKDVGISSSAFTIHKGEIVLFENENALVVSQPVRNTPDSPLAYYVAVRKYKNADDKTGKPSWISVSSLTRRDAHNQYLDDIRKDLATYPNFAEVYNAIKGKKIRGVEDKVFYFTVFKDGQPTAETQQRTMTTLEYVNG